MNKKNLKIILCMSVLLFVALLISSCTQNAKSTKCDADPSKRYVSRDVSQCSVMKYQCKSSETYFSDSCGCGCKTKSTETQFEEKQELKKFSSAEELIEFLQKNTASRGIDYNVRSFGIETSDMAVGSPAPSMEKSAQAAGGSGGATDYSTTNIQVAGVDEADFVKNDGKYIYTLVQDKLVIVEAFPADSMKVLSKTEIEGTPMNMFVNKDRLVVFSNDNERKPMIPQYDIIPVPSYIPTTHVFVYDISDREKPKLLKDYNMKGNYFQSRMIGNFVYFIAKENVYYYGGPRPLVEIPVIRQGTATIISPEIYYFPNPEASYTYHTIASFDIFEDDDKINAKTFMLGYSNNLYVSENNIYIAYQRNQPWNYYQRQSEERFYTVIVPLLPSDARSKINDIKTEDKSSIEKWNKIESILEGMYNKMSDSEKEDFYDKTQEALAEYEAKLEMERRKTIIQKIKIKDGNIDYVAQGEVHGYLLNQFSMDEHKGKFRVATTMEFYGNVVMPMTADGLETVTDVAVSEEPIDVASSKIAPMPRPIRREWTMYNNVYVLDENMKTVGKLEGLAKDERIYSTRFIGDRLFMVTFKRIDPLFVIDLSDAENPKVLGKLKIPGYSDYLHPYDENHIIGIGKETDSNEWGGVSTRGVKLALFDVSDVANPKELDKYEIGEQGTDSEALREHKAFLFDKKKNLLVIPVTEVKMKPYYDERYGYRQKLWQGAYVFNVDLNGFDVKGKISHSEGDYYGYWWYEAPSVVRRSLFMDDVLYTVSMSMIKANDLNDISKEIEEVELPYKQPNNYPYRVY